MIVVGANDHGSIGLMVYITQDIGPGQAILPLAKGGFGMWAPLRCKCKGLEIGIGVAFWKKSYVGHTPL